MVPFKNKSELDMDELWSKMRPPETAEQSFDSANKKLRKLRRWDRVYASAFTAGLMTLPELQANGVRLDWLQRLILSYAEGREKPSFSEYLSVINLGLAEAKVDRLEDPVEDLFCDLIATARGNFRVFLGQWEGAAPYTQTLLEAFELLPNSQIKTSALNAVYALLALSDALAERAAVSRSTISDSKPWKPIVFPSYASRPNLVRQVTFTASDIERYGFVEGDLQPFFLDPDSLAVIASKIAGDSPLEFHPLYRGNDGIVLLHPSNVTTAVRAVMLSVANQYGVSDLFHSCIQLRQEEYAASTGFWPSSRANLPAPTKIGVRGSVVQYDEGSYLHILQLPAPFTDFPEGGFNAAIDRPEINRFISEDVGRFWEFVETRQDCRRSASVVLLSGWGSPQIVHPPIDHIKAPRGWIYLALSFFQAAVLGACDDGKLIDILRLLEQVDRLEKDGFTFFNANGILNLFGFHKDTDGNLLPEGHTDIAPPATIGMPTDALFKFQREGIIRRDYRALPTERAGYKLVQRAEFDPEESPHAYASMDDVQRGVLNGAIAVDGSFVIWVKAESQRPDDREWLYQIWNAALQWLSRVMSAIFAKYPMHFQIFGSELALYISDLEAFERISSLDQNDNIADSIRITVDPNRSVHIDRSWPAWLQKVENIAEIELISAILEAAQNHNECPLTRDQLRKDVTEAIGSPDWRWLHAKEVDWPIEGLAAAGLVKNFERIPFSASALVKCRSVWEFWDRSSGIEFVGETECGSFLDLYRNSILRTLISEIQQFNRRHLLVGAARDYQSARQEQMQWSRAIRALRSIRGEKANQAALTRHSEISAMQRATKAILEIAACEAPQSVSVKPSRADLHELYAKVLLLIGNSNIFRVMKAGFMEPKIKISPAGDLMAERSVFGKWLEPGAAWSNRKNLDAASARYSDRSRPEKEPSSPSTDDIAFGNALLAEYGIKSSDIGEFIGACGRIASDMRSDVAILRRSEFITKLEELTEVDKTDWVRVIERLVLKRREGWTSQVEQNEIDLGRFDRPLSLINRPLLMMDDNPSDPIILIAPALITDAFLYATSGLSEGALNNDFWTSEQAKRLAGARGNAAGARFEEKVALRLNALGLEAHPRQKISALLNQKVPQDLGDIDIFAVNENKTIAWIVEAKDLRLCRSEGEAASRLSEYQGRMRIDGKGRQKPDKLLRHIRRVEYIRARSIDLAKVLDASGTLDVRSLVVVDAPQPMNFWIFDSIQDAHFVAFDEIDKVQDIVMAKDDLH